ncbi:MAG: trigger factor [Christensenellales bacterium]
MNSYKLAEYEKTGTNTGKLTITVDADVFEEGMKKSYFKNAKNYNIPGFRKSKAPRKMIEQYYGEAIFYEDAFEAVFPDAFDQAVSDKDLPVVSRPDIDIVTIGSGKDLVFTAGVTLRPQVELGQYKGIEVEHTEYTVTDEQVEGEIKKEQEKNARYVDSEEPVQLGDRVTLDYSGSTGGVKFDGGTAQNQTLDIGAGQFIAGFEEQMVGMKKGEDRDLTVTFPEKYHNKELSGKEAVFSVHVHEIKKKELPELDDEFVKDICEFDTLDEYKKDLRAKLEKQANDRQKTALENAVIEKITANAKVEIPDIMIENQLDNMINDFAYQLSCQGIRLEDYFKYTKTTQEELRSQYRQEAYNRTKTQLTLQAIRKLEDIEATQEEIDAKIEELANSSRQPVEKYKEQFKGEMLDYLKEEIIMGKLIDKLVAEAKQTEPKPRKTKASAKEKKAPAPEKQDE